MKIAITAAALTAATLTSAFDSNTGKYGKIDTNRAPRLFNPPKVRKAGYSYRDEIIVGLSAQMDSMGMTLKGNVDAEGDMEMHVTAESGGSIKIDVALQNVKVFVNSPFFNMMCESNDRSHSDEALCADLFAAVGQKETILMDKDGNILEMITPDGETVNVAAMAQETLADRFKANQMAASHHFDKTQQFLKLIPDHAVRPGDTWIEDLDLDRIGNFKGQSSLKGYTDYQGADCAVFFLEGNLHLEIELIAGAFGLDPSSLPVRKVDAHIINEILWDVDDEIVRWFTVNVTTAFDAISPLNPAANQTVNIPAELTFSFATDIIERPDHDEVSAGVGEPADAYKQGEVLGSSSFEQEAGTTEGGGSSKGIFFGLLVGVLAFAGLVVYKKRQESWEFITVRPSFKYEFSPVVTEPTYSAPALSLV